jgi:hypothetical protein
MSPKDNSNPPTPNPQSLISGMIIFKNNIITMDSQEVAERIIKDT